MPGFYRYIIMSSAALGALTPATAMAQAQGQDTREEVVIVTAQRRAENIQDVPVAVTAFNGDELESENIFRIDDIASRVPSLFITAGNSVGTTRMNLRGIFSEPNNVGLGTSIPNYVDGVAMGPGRTLDQGLYDLEAIEVLRGPQGTLFGRNATGGAVLVRTKQPTLEQTEGYFSLDFGNYSSHRLSAAANVPLSDRAAVRVAGNIEQHDGYAHNVTQNIDQNDADSRGVRVQGLFQLTDALSMTLRADASWDDQDANVKDFASNASGGSSNPASRDRQVLTDQPSITERQMWSGGAEIVYDAGGMRFISLSNYSWFDYFNQDDVDYTSANVLNTTAAVTQHQWSQEFRIESPAEDVVSWVAGLYFFTEDVKTVNGAYGQFATFGGAPNATTRILIGNGTRETTSSSAFGQAQWRISDQFSLIGGLRYTIEQSDVTKFQPSTLAALGIPPANIQTSSDDGEWSGTVKLVFEPSEDVMTYASFSRGFKASGFNLNPGGVNDIVADPEFVDAYELGLRSELFERALRLNATLFHYQYTDLQRSTFVIPSGGGITTIAFGNAGEVISQGVELEAQWRVTNALTLGGTYSFVDAEFEDYFELVSGVSTDRSGNTPSRTPENTASVYADYLFHPTAGFDVTLSGNWQYRSETFATDQNTANRMIDEASIGNARLTFGPSEGPWEFAAYVKNVTDEAYNLDVIPATGFTAGVGLQMNAPRTYGLEFRARF